MGIAAGSKLGPYEIIAAIGAGGMGEVYRARDTRLQRDVAIKVMPAGFAQDADRLRRFHQEARTVAALNHPNILAIFDTGEWQGAPYLVTELLEGETLRERMNEGPLPQRRAIEYGSQIAEALASAHDKEIVHRDLKPENVFVTRDGHVKVLDFGLAKFYSKPAAAAAGEGVTSGGEMTQSTPGMVLGTVGYMSPEQVRGREVDHRTDIFSFGAVLYEMLSGQRAFRGDTSVETMNAILKEEPPELDTAALHVSPGLERVVRRCLDKEPARRFQSARDLGFSLEALSNTSTSGVLAARQAPTRRRVAILSACALLVIAAAAAAFLLSRRAPERTTYFAIPIDRDVSSLSLSRDGALLAFVSTNDATGQRMLYVQPIGGKTATALTGTEGAMFPFWSPDNQYIGYFANRKLMKVRTSGGTPQVLAPVSTPRGGAWGMKNVIIYNAEAGGYLLRINADGTGAAPLTEKFMTKDQASDRWPVFLPDGDHFLFWSGNFEGIGDHSGIWMSSLEAKDKKFVVASTSNMAYLSPGWIVYVNEKGQLLLQGFDESAAKVRGEARVIGEGVGLEPSIYWAAFTASENGTVVSNTRSANSKSQLTWVDRGGKELGTVGPEGIIFNPSLSPDGTRVAADIADTKAANVDIWIRDLARGTATRWTFAQAEEVLPVWSPDGSHIAYRSGADGLVVKAANGMEKEQMWATLPQANYDAYPNSWTPDGRGMVFTSVTPQGDEHLMMAHPGGKTATPVFPAATGSNQWSGRISPDGKWLVYVSDESGAPEVYATTFPAAVGKWQLSQGGGNEPRWRADGKEIFYISQSGMLTAVPVNAGDTFSSGVPAPLFPAKGRAPLSSTDQFSYDVSRDGQRFLVNRYVRPEFVPPLDIGMHVTALGEEIR